MKAQIYTVPDGIRLGLTSLKRSVEPALSRSGFHAGTHLGEPVVRSRTYPADADTTRERWQTLVHFVENTGYHLKVELTRREADAIGVGGQTQRIVMRPEYNRSAQPGQPALGPSRAAILAGHGSVR